MAGRMRPWRTRLSLGLSALLLSTAAACGGDGPTQPDVPPTVVVAAGVAQSIVSGTTVQLSARVTDRKGAVVDVPTIAWSSSDATVADVSAAGVVAANRSGTTTITAASNGTTGTLTVTVTAGVPVRMVLRTQPAGANAGAPFTTPPVIELRDQAGNLTATTATSVTASLTTGTGTLLGSPSVTSVGGVAAFVNLGIGGLVGPRRLTFVATGLSSVTSDVFDVLPGAAVTLAFRTLPAGGGLNSSFTTQPILEIRDAFANLATNSTASITVAIASGGGTLTGSSVAATGGVATFTALGVSGSPATRTLSFFGTGLASLTVTLQPCDLTRPPQLAASLAARAFATFVSAVPQSDTIVISDRTGSCTAPSGVTSAVSFTGPTGWLTAAYAAAQSKVVIRSTPGSLPVGIHKAVVTMTSDNAGAVTIPVTLALRLSYSVVYGSAADKMNQLDPGGTLVVPASVRDTFNAVVAFPVAYVSRSPSVATVTTDGRITARSSGHAWLLARVSGQDEQADSVFVNVTAGVGPLLRTDVTRVFYDRTSTFSVVLQLDTRGATIGAAQVVFTWPAINDEPGMLRLTLATPGTIGGPVMTTDNGVGTARITIASATGMTGVITLGRFDFSAALAGSGFFTTRFVELLAPDQSSLLASASALLYPVVVR